MLFEEDADPPKFPKANATTSRTMEHYRRLGFADEVRALGLPDDYPRTSRSFRALARMSLRNSNGRADAR